MGQIISIQTFILGILGNVNRQFKQNDEASIRQEIENNLKSLRLKHMNLSYIYVEQKRKIIAHAIMMEELDKDWSKTFDSLQDIEDACDENCTTKVDMAFKSVENTLSAVLYDLRRSQSEIIGRIERYQLSDIRQEEPRHVEAVKLVASLDSTFNDFSNQTRAINNLTLSEQIPKLELRNGIFEYLKGYTLRQPGSMYSLLTDLIDQKFTIPNHRDDDLSFGMLDLLCSGIDVYLYMLAFLLHQYTILSHTYYHQNNLDKYNQYYFSGASAFDDFSSILIDLLDKVVNVLITIEKIEYIRKNVSEFIARKLSQFKPIKSFLLDNFQKIVQLNKPDCLEPNLNYTNSKIETPILEWTSGSIQYAIQFLGNFTEPLSATSIWSSGDTISRLANPYVSIYRDPLERARVIFRLISNGTIQLVAVINDAEQVVFRDIDRDLYNAVHILDEKEALKYVKIYLENGANASAVFENGRRAIHAAAQNNQWTVAEELIKTDANLVNAIDDNGHTPIYLATEAGHANFVQNLLNVKGIDVNVPTSKRSHQLTALHCALYKGYTGIAKKLMQFASIDVNTKTTDGFTALHFATYYNRDTEIISILSNGTRTHFNVQSKQVEIPLYLSLNSSTYYKHIESFVNSGNVSPLQIASAFATKPAVDSMLQNNNNQMQTIHAKTNDGSNLLHFVAFSQDVAILSALEAHMNINQTVDTQNDREFTPIYNANYRDEDPLSRKLTDTYCANINIRLSNNKTLLHLAVVQGHVNATERLCMNGISTEAIDAQGRTTMHYAVWFGDMEIIDTIYRKSGRANAIDFIGIPVIHLVINLTEHKALDIIRLFVETLDFNIRGAFGNTLLHYMCALEYVSVVKYLLTIPNIDTNVVNDHGETILHVAAFVGNFELIQILIDKVNTRKDNVDRDHCTSVLCYAIKGKGTEKIVDFLVDHSYIIRHKDLITSIEVHKFDIFSKCVIKLESEDAKLTDIFLAALEFANCDVAKYCFRQEMFYHYFNSIIIPVKNWTALYYILWRGGDYKMVQCILENALHGLETLEVDDRVDGKSLLHLAIEKGQIDVVNLLLDRGAPFDTADFVGTTQLHLAAQYGLNTVVKRLLEKGAMQSINTTNHQFQTPLFLATGGYGNLELVKYLRELGANLDDDGNENTLVNAAACANKTDFVMYFISLGVHWIRANKDGVTPLHNAAMNNNLELVNYFLDSPTTWPIDVNAQTSDARTPIYYAIQYQGDVDVVNSLLDKYATVCDFDSKKCDNPLTVAIEQNKIDIAKTLLLADADIHRKGVSLKSPLHQAIYSDNAEMVKLLIERGADCNALGPNNKTAIELMIENSSDRAIKFFAYDYKNKQNQTMLHLMAAQNKVEVVKTLLERGAYVDAQDSDGNSPLHLASINGQLEAVKMLCEMKQECINVELKNANNKTALDFAQEEGLTYISEFLKNWRPHNRARRQISEPFSEPPVVSSSASRASWWVRDLIASAFGTFESITKQTSMLSPSYHESHTASAQSISSLSASVNVHSTLLLLDVLARKFTGQSYVGTDSQSSSPLYVRSTSLVIVEQFERMLMSRDVRESNGTLEQAANLLVA